MSIFQNSVLNSFSQDESLVALRWAQFQKYLAKTDFIKGVKEEKYQEGFLKDIFENCLGYTLDSSNPNDFNLEREKKNETDSKKADGVIYVNNEIIGVIELKAQDTKNLDKVQQQAFWYLTQHSNAKYVIISNFDELRFYFDKSTSYEKFSLFNLDYEEFKKLHLILSYESIKEEIPLKIKEKTANFEATISKELYKDFSSFRTHLFENILKNNQNIDKSTLLRLTQKLCDRIIFILFAEDRGLLNPNTIREIREEFSQQKFTEYKLYDIYKFYFQAINEGNEKLQIPKYNGGLFLEDELLDNLIIDNIYLDMEAQKLSDYDFASEVSVNILGHIFEQSLTDLEELQANIDDIDFDKTKSKRKKDGVFYTPEYITKYIVENTLGKMCLEKREILNIGSEVLTSPQNPKRLTKKEQQTKENLEIYKNWLFNLKILDPACGSGAFLNQALEYLIKEHNQLQNDLALMGDLFSSYQVEESVLEHNLYGVDINEDAVEIAKLSLWLRTAQKGRPLTNLANKIKCGNSLISDKSVVDNAFVWEEEFKEVFENGGFDVVIGNPPYVDIKSLPKEINKYLSSQYKTANKRINLFSIFIEKSLINMNPNGMFSFIIPSSILTQESYKEMRKYILDNSTINQIVRLPNESFGGSIGDVKVDTIILTIQKEKIPTQETMILVYIGFDRIDKITPHNTDIYFTINQQFWEEDEDNIFRINIDKETYKLIDKIENNTLKFIDCSDFSLGLTPYDSYRGHTKEQIKNQVFHSNKKENETFKKLLAGNDVKRYNVSWNGEMWISYGKWLGAPRESRFFTQKRIIVKQIIDWTDKRIWATLTDEELYNTQNAFNILPHDKYIGEYFIALLNSKLMTFFHKKKYLEEFKDRFQKILIKDCKEFPIKDISLEQQQPFIQKADLMLELNKKLQEIKQNFITELKLEKIPKKLANFEELDFEDFVKEYKKAKKIKFKDKLEERNFKNDWQRLFENDKKEVLEIQNQINKTDKEIDNMVYKLYDLTEDEIKIVEGI